MSMIIKPKGATKNKKRIGRGRASGTGTTAGKGNNGQRARAGGGVAPGFEGGQMPLYRRVPRRGFSNFPFKIIFEEISLFTLEKNFTAGDVVSVESLKEKELISKSAKYVKILNNGNLTKSLKIKGIQLTKTAKVSIEKASGSIEE